MTAMQALRDANLSAALQQLQAEVRREPAIARHRVFLFQLLAVLGDWDRALTQLNVARDMDGETLMMAQTYQELLRCEALRHEVFAGRRTPLWFGEPEPWMARLWEAHRLSCDGQHSAAQDLRAEAFEQLEPRGGTLHQHPRKGPGEHPTPVPPMPFEWIADADSRLGPVLEAIVNGRYYWVPMHRIAKVDIEPATDLRDLVWLPAHFQWANGGEMVGFIPTRYPGSEKSPDDLIRLARKTDWVPQAADVYHGLGQRTLTTDADEYPVLNVKRIEFATIPSST